MKNILIVGGFGFLGSTLVNQLYYSNKYDITVLVKKSSNEFRIKQSILKKIKIAYVENIKFDSFFKLNKFYSIINASVIYNSRFDYEIFQTNFLQTLKIIEFGKISSCKNFITIDSFYRKFKNYDQKKVYTYSKKILSNHLKSIKKVRIINLQLEHMYGPYDSETKFLTKVIRSIHNKDKELQLTKGTQKRDFIFVNDVCDLIMEILIKFEYFNLRYSTIEVGNGESIEIRDFIKKIKLIFKNSSTKLKFGDFPENTNEIIDSKANLRSLPKFMNWKTKTSIEDGIKQILTSIK